MLDLLIAASLLAQTAPASTPPRPGEAQRPRASLQSYFSSDDYPPVALERGAQGTVHFRLQIDAQGRVTGCRVTRSSSDAALDAATCAILLGRARYVPARDVAGRPVRSGDWGRVTWRLPPPSPGRPFARLVTISRLSSDGAGRLDCVVTTNGVVEADVGPSHCGELAGIGANELLRQAPVPIEVTLVSVAGPENAGVEAVGVNEASYGDLQYDVVADLVIGQNGRIVQCRNVTRNIPSPAPAGELPGPCELPPPGAPPLFEPTTDPAPRRARHRSALYVKGWPVDGHTPPATPAPPRP